ncbi:MAG: LapA family protein [Actinomycetota bacterium]
MARDDRDRRSSEEQDDRERQALGRERRSRGGKLVLALTIVVLVILFAVQNADSTRLRFLWFEFAPPLIWVIVVVGLAGAVAGFIVGRPGRRFRAKVREQDDR